MARNCIADGFESDSTTLIGSRPIEARDVNRLYLHFFPGALPTQQISAKLTNLQLLNKANKLDKEIDSWLSDPLNPHEIAELRTNSYTFYVVTSLVRCLLDYADSEFTRDTSESVARARVLYTTALYILDAENLMSTYDGCSKDISVVYEELVPLIPDLWRTVFGRIFLDLGGIDRRTLLDQILKLIESKIHSDSGISIEDKIAYCRNLVNAALDNPDNYQSVNALLDNSFIRRKQVQTLVTSDPAMISMIGKIATRIENETINQFNVQLGVKPEIIRTPKIYSSNSLIGSIENSVSVKSLDDEQLDTITGDITDLDQSYVQVQQNTGFGTSAVYTQTTITEIINRTLYNITYTPSTDVSFCIPRNPVVDMLRFRANLNLFKIRNCRNIAGIVRELDAFAAPTDATSGLPGIGTGGALQLPGLGTFRPTIYRYPVLIERAKQLVQIAQQIEASMLASLEKLDSERYAVMKAKQDLGLAKAGIRLQDLRITEATSQIKLTELQEDRADIQFDHFESLINKGLIDSEIEQLGLLTISTTLSTASAALSLIAGQFSTVTSVITPFGPGLMYNPGASLAGLASNLSMLSNSSNLGASLAGLDASFERRAQDWEFNKQLAGQDIKIAQQQTKIAEDHLRVVGQERQISQIQSDHAEATVDFLVNKFTNAELYEWMSKILEGVYAFFLQQATAMAKTASRQLAFERQELPPDFIKNDYWEAPSDNLLAGANQGSSSPSNDRKGLTGSVRLLQDIFQLDQYAFETDRRRLEITRPFSVAALAPIEFQRFRETGQLIFNTSMEKFDRDFPGHYMRLIRRVKLTLVALVPPTQGIKAVLQNTGVSYVVIGSGTAGFQKVPVARDPELVALSGANEATGLFELQQMNNDKLLPFENTGVECTWILQMPKASNSFDFNTIADVIFTVEYTALHSNEYKTRVIEELDTKVSADRSFAFRSRFADAWYDLANYEQMASPMTVSFDISKFEFPANVRDPKIENIAFYFIKSSELNADDPNDLDAITAIENISIESMVYTPSGSANAFPSSAAVSANKGIISTRQPGTLANWTNILNKGVEGVWTLAFEKVNEPKTSIRALFKQEKIADIVMVITYGGELPKHI